jgi:hypothetical protein
MLTIFTVEYDRIESQSHLVTKKSCSIIVHRCAPPFTHDIVSMKTVGFCFFCSGADMSTDVIHDSPANNVG